MENPGVFRTVMNGFEKKAVLAYIEQINERSTQVQQALNEQLSALTASVEQLSEKSENLELENKTFCEAQELSSREQKRLEEENLSLEARLSESERLLNEARAKTAALEKELEQKSARLAELEAQSEKYNIATSQIGAAIMEAQQRADEIISEAKAKAHETVRDAATQALTLAAEIKQLKSGISGVRQDVSAASQAFADKLLFIEKEIDDFSGALCAPDSAPVQPTDAEQVTEPKDDIGSIENTTPGQNHTGGSFFR